MKRLAAGLALLALVGLSVPVIAQQGDVSQKRVTIKLDYADVRYALKQLFESVNVNYNLDPNVQGQVTVSLTDVPFDTALNSLLRPLNLTYRIESGVYYITVRVEDNIPPPTTDTTSTEPTTRGPELPEKIVLQYASVYQIAQALGGNVAQIGGMYDMQMGGGMGGGFGGFGGGGFGGGGMGGFGGGMGGFGGGMGGQGGFGGGGFGGFGGGGRGGGMGGGMGGGYGGGGMGGGFGGGGFR